MRVAEMVATGQIKAAMAPMFEQTLRDEQAGKSTIMRDPKVKPKLPRKPSWG